MAVLFYEMIIFEYCLSVLFSKSPKTLQRHTVSVSVSRITILIKHLYMCTGRDIYEYALYVLCKHIKKIVKMHFTEQVRLCVSLRVLFFFAFVDITDFYKC